MIAVEKLKDSITPSQIIDARIIDAISNNESIIMISICEPKLFKFIRYNEDLFRLNGYIVQCYQNWHYEIKW